MSKDWEKKQVVCFSKGSWELSLVLAQNQCLLTPILGCLSPARVHYWPAVEDVSAGGAAELTKPSFALCNDCPVFWALDLYHLSPFSPLGTTSSLGTTNNSPIAISWRATTTRHWLIVDINLAPHLVKKKKKSPLWEYLFYRWRSSLKNRWTQSYTSLKRHWQYSPDFRVIVISYFFHWMLPELYFFPGIPETPTLSWDMTT